MFSGRELLNLRVGRDDRPSVRRRLWTRKQVG
jgi:hypothetical protein